MKCLIVFLLWACGLFAGYVPFEEGFFSFPSKLRCRKEFVLAYEKNHFCHVSENQPNRIPKIIHHVWLGSKLPRAYQKIVESWKTYHPEWEHKLWTDEDVGSFPLETGNILYKIKNHGQRSDIFRLEILNRFGGLYVDTDFLCLQPHDAVHKCCDFYSSIGGSKVYIGVIGSIPRHPILTSYLAAIRKNSTFRPTPYEIAKTTGAILFTKIICEYISKGQDDVIFFPPLYYYPFPADLRYYYWMNKQDFSVVKPFITEHSLAVHLWACSWTNLKRRRNNNEPDWNRRFPCQKKISQH